MTRQTLQFSGNTARSSCTTHVKRSLARRGHSTRNGSLPTPSTSWKQGERGKLLNNSRTRAAKAKAQEEYTAVDREGKRSIKKDKRDYIDDLARQAETAARQGNLRDQHYQTSHPQRQNCPSAATHPQRQRSRRSSWLSEVGRLQDWKTRRNQSRHRACKMAVWRI